MKKAFDWFFMSNSLYARLARTVVEGAISFLLVNVDILFEGFSIPVGIKTLLMGLTVAIVSPILATIGEHRGADENRNKSATKNSDE